MKFCVVAQTLFVELHLDVVLEVLQVVDKNLFCMKLVDIYHCFTNDGDIKLNNNRRKKF